MKKYYVLEMESETARKKDILKAKKGKKGKDGDMEISKQK